MQVHNAPALRNAQRPLSIAHPLQENVQVLIAQEAVRAPTQPITLERIAPARNVPKASGLRRRAAQVLRELEIPVVQTDRTDSCRKPAGGSASRSA